MKRAAWIGVAAALALSGCTGTATQLLAVVDSDYEPGEELGFVRVLVQGPDVELEDADRLEYEVVASDPELNQLTVPFSFGVRPRGGDADRRARIEVTGFANREDFADGIALTRQTRRTGFEAGRMLELPMFLSRECEGVSCGSEQTCDRGECVPMDVPARELERAER